MSYTVRLTFDFPSMEAAQAFIDAHEKVADARPAPVAAVDPEALAPAATTDHVDAQTATKGKRGRPAKKPPHQQSDAPPVVEAAPVIEAAPVVAADMVRSMLLRYNEVHGIDAVVKKLHGLAGVSGMRALPPEKYSLVYNALRSELGD